MDEHRSKKLLDQVRACREVRRGDAIRLRHCACNTETDWCTCRCSSRIALFAFAVLPPGKEPESPPWYKEQVPK